MKNALIIYAHPDLKSSSGSLLDVTCDTLKRIGYDVDVSDLYSEYVEPSLSKYKESGDRYTSYVRRPLQTQKICFDTKLEMDKIKKADLIIFQFDVTSNSIPGILASWLDLMLSGYVKYPYPVLNTLDEGPMKGKRTILSAITDDPSVSLEDVDLVLWSVQNNLLRGCGFDVLRPQCSQLSTGYGGKENQKVLTDWKNRLENIETDAVNVCFSIPNFQKWMQIKRTDKLKETKRQKSIENFMNVHMPKRVMK